MIQRALAASFDFITQPGADGGTEQSNLTVLISNVINIFLFIAGALAIIFLIYSGILYITSAGNPDAAKKGQQGVLNAVIGLVIIVLAFFIARAVSSYAASVGGGTA